MERLFIQLKVGLGLVSLVRIGRELNVSPGAMTVSDMLENILDFDIVSFDR